MRPIPAHLGAAERAALGDLRAWLEERFGTRVAEVVLFGSRARGEGHPSSDVDVLVAVDALSGTERREIGMFSGDLLTRHDVLVSPFAVSKARMDELRSRERLIAREIDRDGIVL